MAAVGLTATGRAQRLAPGTFVFERATAAAALRVAANDAVGAARLLSEALAVAPKGNAGWLIPIEPLLAVHQAPEVWATVLAAVSARAR